MYKQTDGFDRKSGKNWFEIFHYPTIILRICRVKHLRVYEIVANITRCVSSNWNKFKNKTVTWRMFNFFCTNMWGLLEKSLVSWSWVFNNFGKRLRPHAYLGQFLLGCSPLWRPVDITQFYYICSEIVTLNGVSGFFTTKCLLKRFETFSTYR